MKPAMDNVKYAKGFKDQLTFRGIIIGAIGSIIITTSSMYVALRMGALPWPTIFVAVLSMTILRILKNTNLNEINVTHTAMSAGAMVAGGLAFTIPGIWMFNESAEVSFMELVAITLSGAILGVIFKIVTAGKFDRYKALSLITYIAMGWIAIFTIKPIINMTSLSFFMWILGGGIVYSLGTIFYSVRSIPYNHAIWHVFVLAGTILHFVGILLHLV